MEETQGTVHDFPGFNAEADAKAIKNAMKGAGTDEKAITQIVGTRSNQQRLQIKLEFRTLFGQDLAKELKSELSKNYEELVVSLFMSPSEYDAYSIHKAIKGAGTDEKALIEILSTRTNAEIKAATEQYKKLYKADMSKHIQDDTSGHFQRLLYSLAQGARKEDEPLNAGKASTDAHALYQAGEAKWGTDEAGFNAVLASRSFPQIRLTLEEYEKVSGKTLEKAIDSELSGTLESGFKAIVKASRSRSAYFAERLYKSMKGLVMTLGCSSAFKKIEEGLGTDDDTLIRVMVSRSEIDMVQIKHWFLTGYGKSLAQFIKDDCSGDYKQLLMLICGN